MSAESYKRYGEDGGYLNTLLWLSNAKLRAEELRLSGLSPDSIEQTVLDELKMTRGRQWPLTPIITALFPDLGKISN